MRAWINYGNIYGWWIFPVPLWLNVPWSNKEALGTNKQISLLFAFALYPWKSCVICGKTFNYFQEQKNNNKNKYKYFKTRPRNWTPEIQVFKDANETCRRWRFLIQAVLDDRVSGHNILNRWILFSQKGRQRYLVVIIIDCIGTCLSGSLYSMAERQGQEKLHHFRLKKAFKR